MNPAEPASPAPAASDGVMRIIKLTCAALGVLAVVITIAFFSWWLFKDRIVFGHDRFDQVQWMTAAATLDNTCHRGDMAYDLQQRLLRPGLSHDQVTMLLGRPEWEDPQQIEYDLGKCMHVEHGLRVFFDAQGRLTHSRISQH